MDLTHDDVAGIVDLFGALSESDLRRGIEELAFRQGEKPDSDAVRDLIDGAKADFSLAEIRIDDERVLASGPTAFSTLPDGAEDLPHILDVERRSPSPKALETAVRKRLATEAATISEPERAAELVDVTYDAEAWAGIDLKDVRERLESIAADPG
ncbi:MAG: DUF7109 family protein [Halodesulfurarchaeum sp.]